MKTDSGVATAPTVYGIETCEALVVGILLLYISVATAPTVYGIETLGLETMQTYMSMLQQHLPFTVLKPYRRRHNLLWPY